MCHANLTRMQIVRPAVQRTFTLTRTVLLLHMDKYEPHNFCQFGNEQSIGRVGSFSTIVYASILLQYHNAGRRFLSKQL